jgi:hypothetical protein
MTPDSLKVDTNISEESAASTLILCEKKWSITEIHEDKDKGWE